MALGLRLFLLIGAALMMAFVLLKIRRSQLLTSDAIFWFMLSLLLIILAVFPQLAFWASAFIGVESPANLVFLVIIAILLIKLLLNTVEISQLRNKITTAMQKEALLRDESEADFAVTRSRSR